MTIKKFFFIFLSIALPLTFFSAHASSVNEDELCSLSLESSSAIEISLESDVESQRPALRNKATLTHVTSAKQLDQNLQGLYQDVKGYEDNCLRWSICCWRLSGNSAQTLSMIMSGSATVLTGLAAIPGFLDDTTNETFILLGTLASISSVALIGLKKYSADAITDRREQLRQVLHDHGIEIPLDDEEENSP